MAIPCRGGGIDRARRPGHRNRRDGRRVPATNLGDSRFRVTTIPDDLISCVVYDRATTPDGLAQAPPAPSGPTTDGVLPGAGDALPTTGADLRYPTGVLAVVAGMVLVAGYPRRRPAATARPCPAAGRLHPDVRSDR